MTGDPEDRAEAIRNWVAAVVPGVAVALAGVGLMLGCALLWLENAPALAARLAGGMGRGWGVSVTIAVQAAPLIVLALCGRRIMGYTIARIGRPEDRE